MIEGYTEDDSRKKLIDEIQNYRYDNPMKVLELCNKHMHLLKESNDTYITAYLEYHLAEAYYRVGRLDDMMLHVIRGLTVHKEHSFYKLEIRSYNLLGIYFVSQGDLQTGLNYYLLGFDLVNRYNLWVEKKIIYNNFGDLYMCMGDYKTAIYYFSKVKEYMRELTGRKITKKERSFVCIWHSNLVESYINTKNYELAKKYMYDLVMLMNDDFLSQHSPLFYSLLTQIEYYTGKEMQAQSSASLLIQSVKAKRNRCRICTVYVPICKFFIQYDMLTYAKELIEEIVLLSQEIKNPFHWVQVLDVCIVYYKKIGNHTSLLDAYEQHYHYMKRKEAEDLRVREKNIKNQLELHKAIKLHKTMMQKNEELTRMSEHDALTGLPNRYSINKYCEKIFAKACKNQQKFGLIMIDIDYFKQYNDTYGHVEGDKCIVTVARQISKLATDDIYAARYGGDEFLVMVLDKEDEYLQMFAQSLRDSVEQQKIEHKASNISLYVTVTQGIINEIPSREDTMIDFVHKADLALYKVKKQVRNAIGCYEPMEE